MEGGQLIYKDPATGTYYFSFTLHDGRVCVSGVHADLGALVTNLRGAVDNFGNGTPIKAGAPKRPGYIPVTQEEIAKAVSPQNGHRRSPPR